MEGRGHKITWFPPPPRMESWFMTRQYARAAISVSLALAGVTTIFNLTPAAERGRQRVLLPIDSVLSKAYRWRSVGPERGGRSIAISGVKGQPKVGYFGATGGGLWKTTDGGETWTWGTHGQHKRAS